MKECICGEQEAINKLGNHPKCPAHIELGLIDGEICNRDGCIGTIRRSKVEDCYSHLNPPCNNCLGPSLEYCPECDWDGSME